MKGIGIIILSSYIFNTLAYTQYHTFILPLLYYFTPLVILLLLFPLIHSLIYSLLPLHSSFPLHSPSHTFTFSLSKFLQYLRITLRLLCLPSLPPSLLPSPAFFLQGLCQHWLIKVYIPGIPGIPGQSKYHL